MDIELKPDTTLSGYPFFQVSILVLMDIELKRSRWIMAEIALPGFNPCFNGYRT